MKRSLLLLLILVLAFMKVSCSGEKNPRTALHIARVTIKKMSKDCDYPFALMIDGRECLYPINWSNFKKHFEKENVSYNITYRETKKVEGDCAKGKSIEISYLEQIP